MHKGLKRTLAAALCACLTLGAMTGCSKKEKKIDASAPLMSIEKGASISAGAAEFYLRFQQAEFELGIGNFLRGYYGDLWNSDLTGSGEAYGNTFKTQILEDLEHLVLANQHAADYGVELSDDEKKAISAAADQFIADNTEESLAQLGATKESVEEMLTLYAVRTKVEEKMSADVDTEVSDEEAAQRTVAYAMFTAQTEAETEETEAVTEGEEAASEAVLEEESEAKTGAGETEVDEANEAVAEEAVTEAETEAEAETESPEMIEARMIALTQAQAFLDQAKAADNFETFAEESGVYHSTFTFGDDDTYPDAAIIEATKGLEDGTIVDDVVVVGNSYYVLCVTDAFDEEATAEKKEEIVEQRKADAVEALYEEWNGATEFSFDQETWTSMTFDRAFEAEAVEETEGLSEALSEAAEEVAESATEA